MSEMRYVQLHVNGYDLIFPKEVGMKLFDALVNGDEAYRREYDWNTKQEWVEPVDVGNIRVSMIQSGSFAVMKIIGANKIQERIAERERKDVEAKRG